MADRRASRSRRIASTLPSWLFGVPVAVPESAARAAASASTVSDLPRSATQLTIGAVDLDDANTSRTQMTHQPGTVAASAFDTDTDHAAMALKPAQQLDVASIRGRKQSRPE